MYSCIESLMMCSDQSVRRARVGIHRISVSPAYALLFNINGLGRQGVQRKKLPIMRKPASWLFSG